MMIESAAGESSAPPKPWSARAPTRAASDHAMPESSDPMAKTATPAAKTRLRPSSVGEPTAQEQRPGEEDGVRSDDPLDAFLREARGRS